MMTILPGLKKEANPPGRTAASQGTFTLWRFGGSASGRVSSTKYSPFPPCHHHSPRRWRRRNA